VCLRPAAGGCHPRPSLSSPFPKIRSVLPGAARESRLGPRRELFIERPVADGTPHSSSATPTASRLPRCREHDRMQGRSTVVPGRSEARPSVGIAVAQGAAHRRRTRKARTTQLSLVGPGNPGNRQNDYRRLVLLGSWVPASIHFRSAGNSRGDGGRSMTTDYGNSPFKPCSRFFRKSSGTLSLSRFSASFWRRFCTAVSARSLTTPRRSGR